MKNTLLPCFSRFNSQEERCGEKIPTKLVPQKKKLQTSGLKRKIHAPKIFHPPPVISNGPSLKAYSLVYDVIEFENIW